MNPTQAVLEERMAALEGGVAALALASGQAASLFAVQNICHAGDNFVCSTDIYGGTWNLFQNTMATMGIECRFVDPADPENFRKATDAKTRCYYGETLPNPKLAVFFVALFPQFIPRAAPVLPCALAMAAVIVAVDLIWYSVLALLVARARRAFVDGGWGRRIERLTGAVVIGLGIRLALERR